MNRILSRGFILSSACATICFSLLGQENSNSDAPKKSVWDPAGWYFVHPDKPRQPPQTNVTHHQLRSEKMNREVGFNILVPPGYETGDRHYPVIYMLHGATGHEGCRGFAPHVYRLMVEGKASPSIWVWPNGGQGSMWRDGPDGNPHRIYVDHFFVRELIPYIDAHWRTIASREGRAVTGFSMGGYGCIRFAFTYPELFAACLSISGGAFFPKDDAEARKQPSHHFPGLHVQENLSSIKDRMAIKLIAGTKDFNYQPMQKLAKVLDEVGIAYEQEWPEGLTHQDLGKYFSPDTILWLHEHVTTAAKSHTGGTTGELKSSDTIRSADDKRFESSPGASPVQLSNEKID